jgi:hypothetical protein
MLAVLSNFVDEYSGRIPPGFLQLFHELMVLRPQFGNFPLQARDRVWL